MQIFWSKKSKFWSKNWTIGAVLAPRMDPHLCILPKWTHQSPAEVMDGTHRSFWLASLDGGSAKMLFEARVPGPYTSLRSVWTPMPWVP